MKPDPGETIDEFEARAAVELKSFCDWWRRQLQSNADHFPVEMAPGDWDEQFWMYDPDVNT